MENRQPREVSKRRVDDVVIIAGTGNAGIGIKARKDRVLVRLLAAQR